jgi:NADH-quinone oxidoreductase subunit E
MGSPTSLMDESLFDGSAARPLSVIPGAPAPAAPVAGAEPAPRAHGRPAGLAGPRGGAKDDLKRIDGVDAKVEQQLNELGVFHFDQIAGWDAANIEWVDGHIAFAGRIARERWIEQAAALARGGGGGS